jgi:hypothetical protein
LFIYLAIPFVCVTTYYAAALLSLHRPFDSARSQLRFSSLTSGGSLGDYLFSLVFVGYILVICLKDKIEPTFSTGMVSIMTLLIGFFSGLKLGGA